MKTQRLFWLLTAAPALMVPLASGCVFLKAPEPEPTPTPAPTPKAPYFDPAAGQPQGKVLNDPANPLAPTAFRISTVISGDRVALQAIKIQTPAVVSTSGDGEGTAVSGAGAASAGTVRPGVAPTPQVSIGPPDTVRLAGIVAPTVDPGLQGARTAIASWTAGQDLTVHQDTQFPAELDGTKLVQVFFKGRAGGPYEGQQLSLNRMLVRSGWAVVDLYSPTSFDTSQWIFDEEHAKKNHLGIWKYGQIIQQRLPAKVTNVKNSQSKVGLSTTPPGSVTTTQTATQSTTTTQVAPGPGSSSAPAAGMPGSSAAAVPNSSTAAVGGPTSSNAP